MDTRNPLPDDHPYAAGELAPTATREMFWRRAAQVAIVGIFLLMFGALLELARAVFLPFTAAFVIGTMLGPLTERARIRGVPQWLSALVVVLLVIAIMNLLVVLLAAPVSDWISKAPEIGARLKDKLSLHDYPLQLLRNLRDTLNPGGDHSAPLDLGLSNLVQPALSLLTPALGFVTPAIGQLLIFFGALFFFLSTRAELRRGVSMLFADRDARLRALHIMAEAEGNLTTYFTTVGAIYFAEGVAVGIACFFIGLPNAGAWGALTFVLCFLPYIGPALVVLILFGNGLIHFPGVTHALVAPGVYIGLATLEGTFITPAIIGRRLTLSPLAVFLSQIFWAWLWGPVGAFLATPLFTIALAVVSQIFPKEDSPLPG